MFIIGDGYGRGYTAKVSTKNQLAVQSDSMPRSARASHDGNMHALTTGVIALTTTGSYNGMFYLLNSSTAPCYIWALTLTATVAARWKFVKNPTTGTLISGGGALTSRNANFAVTTALVATAKSGSNGATVTDGLDLFFSLSGAYDVAAYQRESPIILGQSDALAIMCQPSATCDAYVSAMIAQETLDF